MIWSPRALITPTSTGVATASAPRRKGPLMTGPTTLTQCSRPGLASLPLDITYEPDQTVEVGLLVVVHRHVGAIWAKVEAALGDATSDHFHVGRVHGVMCRSDHQGRHGYPTEIPGAVPVDQLAASAELARALHQHVERVVELCERSIDRIGPLVRRHSQYMVHVVVPHQ